MGMRACGATRKGMVDEDAALSSGCPHTQLDIMAHMYVEGENGPLEGFHATHIVSPGEQLWLPISSRELDGHQCSILEYMELEPPSPGWSPKGCKRGTLRKFDKLYSMSLFAVALPHSLQSGMPECTWCDLPGEANEELAALLNECYLDIDDVAELLRRDAVFEVSAFEEPVDAKKSSDMPLSWPQIRHSLTTLMLGNLGLCTPCVACPRERDLAPEFSIPLNARCQTTTQPKGSWWIRTIPALQADAQLWGAPSDIIADINTAGRTDSAHISQQKMLQEVSKAMKVARCSVSSLKGNKHMPNQDRAVCASLGMGAVQLFAVLDGHGNSGHVVADVSTEVLPKLLLQGLAKAGSSFPCDGDDDAMASWVKASAKAFEDMQGFFETVGSLPNFCEGNAKVQAIDAREGGTTATMVLLFPGQRALVAHVGDSRAILATRPRSNLSAPWSVKELTRDHKPDIPAERARIEEAGARVGASNAYDPTPRVISPGQTWPYIALSRCVGDLHAHTQGVSAVPETSLFGKLYDPSTEEAILIICSDGVWDVMDAATVVECAVSPKPASAVACEAYARWSELGYEDAYVDDITVVVKFLGTSYCEAI